MGSAFLNVFLFLSIFCVAHNAAFAQSSTVAAGGDAVGSGGSSAYTIGQPFYTTDEGASKTVTKGLQQTYEVSVVSGNGGIISDINVEVFPNPTTGKLIIHNHSQEDKSIYTLTDQQGRILMEAILEASATTLTMDELPAATYILQVTTENSKKKTFKIIKH